ncbi:hypothetical protein [Mucilaginibacter pedocola]|uniref:CHRD domain-containing protein n=1 Tax=Mucilaginibacter pedocola TaxID=1792845 RepID=A0A1S9PJE4_9SPHI|nr:hypothetical protein [Mucilaginibacter pedocola]OOQ60708.1 hypothetical protein BC343_24255 [Mucilaginibacter pedocola]
MKKLKSAILLALIVATTGFSSCKKDSNGNTSGKGAATVKASLYGFDGTSGTTFSSTAAGIVKVGNMLTITAIKEGSKESITIVLQNVTGTGTFGLLQDNSAGHGAILSKDYTQPADGTLNYSTSLPSPTGVKGGGEVKITTLTSTTAEGTFYIVGHNSAGKDGFVENGTFSGKVN